MTKDCREDSHGDEGCKCGGENDKSRVLHRHQSGNEERFVANLGEDDHRERENKGV